MKKIIGLITVLGLIFTAVVYFVHSEPEKIKNYVEIVLPTETESPYSIKWGAELARVVDQDGKGVPHAAVTFTKHLGRDCNGNTTEEPPAWQGITVATNENGEFVYPRVIWQDEDGDKKPQPRITIKAEGFLSRSSIHVGQNYADDNGEIDLFRIGRIEGAIIDPNGQPLANVPVWFNTDTRYKNPNSSCGGCFSANLKTDEAGAFVIDKVPPGQHMIKFPGSSGGCGPEPKVEKIPFKEYATFQTVHMKDGEEKTDVFLDLRQSRGTIKGKVVDKYNRPMTGVNAILFRVIKRYFADGSGWSSSTENLKSASTDENGDYVLDHIPAGDYQLQAQYPYEKDKNYKSGDPLNIYLAGKQEVTFNLVLERQDDSLPKSAHRDKSLFEVPLPEGLGPRDMMIVDPRGNGIAGASVVFDDEITIEDHKTHQKTKKEWEGASLTTDSQGIFMLPDELETMEGKWVRCRTSIKADGFEQRSVSIGPYHLKKAPRIDILPYGEIRGQLIGWDGKPVKGNISRMTRLTAYHNPGSASSGGSGGIQVTGKDGRFTVSQAPEGAHVLRYEVEDKENNTRYTGGFIVYTRDGKPVNDIVIDLREDACAAVGRVLDLDGKPVKKAYVRLSKTVRWGYDHFGHGTTQPEFYRSENTNRKGEYSIENIRPGVYEIEAVLEGDKRRTSDKMTIAVADEQEIELDVRLKR